MRDKGREGSQQEMGRRGGGEGREGGRKEERKEGGGKKEGRRGDVEEDCDVLRGERSIMRGEDVYGGNS